MNSSHPQHPWSRLVAAARAVQDDRDALAPFGFATRVAARALGSEFRAASLFELFAMRAVAVACLLALASVAVNYKTLAFSSAVTILEDSEPAPSDDAVTVVLDLTD